MHKVTDEQIDFILNDIKSNGVHIEDLQYNLLDHICCIIENEMTDKDDFYKFYEDIIPRFFKKELKEIQEETDNLLTFKHYYAMKNTLKISGIASSILMLLGAIFKTMHWPGASVMIVLGAATFSLIFLPLMIILKFKDEEKTTDKLVFAFSFILAMMAIMGTLFKIMHWPYATFLMLTSSTLFIFGYVPIYFLSRYRRVEQRFNTIINSVLMVGFGGMLYALMNVSGSKSYMESVYASYEFMNNNSEKLIYANSKIASKNKQNIDKSFYELSQNLYNHIDDTKAYLVSIVNNSSIENSKKLKIYEVKNPNAYQSIKTQFEDGKGKYSITSLETKIEEYNTIVSQKFPDNTEKLIAIDELQLDKTVLSMVLFELSQIQLQLATNENGYLSSAVSMK